MISRRNIRVKVMQVLYTLDAMEELPEKNNPVKLLQTHFTATNRLFIYLLRFLTEVAQYAEMDAKHRGNKQLPSEEDLNVNIKLAGNTLLWSILESPSYKNAIAEFSLNFEDTPEHVKKVYQKLCAAEIYKNYITIGSREKNTESAVIKYIFTDLMLPNEEFIYHIEDHFLNWDDDGEMMEQLMMNYLQKPAAHNLQEVLGEEKRKFAKDLLVTVIDKQEYLMELIKPHLKNWDADRIAKVDMMLMQMGVCEFLYFETIPTKVTMNEYIDLSKAYSTSQSGQFVNGILDSIHKELVEKKQIHKIDFKKQKA